MDRVDFRVVKTRVAQLFPPGHPLREAVLAEPDVMMREEFCVKQETYVRMAWTLRQAR